MHVTKLVTTPNRQPPIPHGRILTQARFRAPSCRVYHNHTTIPPIDTAAAMINVASQSSFGTHCMLSFFLELFPPWSSLPPSPLCRIVASKIVITHNMQQHKYYKQQVDMISPHILYLLKLLLVNQELLNGMNRYLDLTRSNVIDVSFCTIHRLQSAD